MPVLIILAVLWAVVLVPPLLRSRRQRTADSIVDFNYKLDVLGRTNDPRRRRRPLSQSEGMPTAALDGRAVMTPVAPPARSSAALRSAKRRREVFQVLGAAFVVTLLLATAVQSPVAWALQIFVDILAAAYIALWAWARSLQADRLDKVRYIPELRVPELALRRSASS